MTSDELKNREWGIFIEAMKAAGIPCPINELEAHPEYIPKALDVVEEQFQVLTSPKAKSNIVDYIGSLDGATEILIAEFRRNRTAILEEQEGASTHGWCIGEELRTTIKAKHVDSILELVQDRTYGRARRMLPYALARFKKRREDIIPVLVPLLEDETVMGQVLDALGKLKAVEAIPEITKCLTHHEWKREAQKTLTKLGVKIPEQADMDAIRAYREHSPAIPESAVADHITMSFGGEEVLPFLLEIAALISEGFSHTEASNLAYFIRDMEHDATDQFGFDVVCDDTPITLYIQVFMDDVDTPDITCVTTDPLLRRIAALAESYQDEGD